MVNIVFHQHALFRTIFFATNGYPFEAKQFDKQKISRDNRGLE